MEEKFKISDDIEKTSKFPVPIIVFLVIFTLGIFLILFSYIKRGKSDIFGYNYGFFVVCGFMLLFPIGASYGVYKTVKSSKSMKKHIEDGTIITKKAKIIKFSYYYSSDSDFGTKEGYYVIATDGMSKYKSKLFERAMLTGGYFHMTIDEEFLQKKGIPYSPRDPKYDKDVVIKRIREIDEEINLLTEQRKSMSFFAKIKVNSKISDLNTEKDRLFPPSLICGGENLYIGDEVTILVDPDNPKNYEMRI